MKARATFIIEKVSNKKIGKRLLTGRIEFNGPSSLFEKPVIPSTIHDVSVWSDKGTLGSSFVGEFRDAFGGWPAFVGHNGEEEIAFSLRTQWKKVYNQ